MHTPGSGDDDGDPSPRRVRPERRTRRDLLTTAVITVVMAVVAAAVLWGGSAARSEFRAADSEQPVYGPAGSAPTELRHLWSHDSVGTGAPLTTKGNLVTVDPDGTLVGRDAGSGEQQWSYSHAGRFCAATFYADVLAAAFDGASGCSDVTAIDPTLQHYASTRQSAFPDAMQLTSTWRHAMAFSPERLEIWRDDLVRTVEYGAVAAPQEADMQPRTGCTLVSATLVDERFAVSEECPGDDSARLTISATVPKDNRKPEEIASDVTGADGLWVMAVREQGVLALTRRGPAWAVEWFTSPVDYSPLFLLGTTPRLMPSPQTLSGDDTQLRWFDGAATHAFDLATPRLSWTAPDTSGPGLTGGWSPDPASRGVSGWVALPVPDGLSVVDHRSGAAIRHLPTEGAPASAAVGLSQIGDILYERRDETVHAYKFSS